jgi:hypothetical protein
VMGTYSRWSVSMMVFPECRGEGRQCDWAIPYCCCSIRCAMIEAPSCCIKRMGGAELPSSALTRRHLHIRSTIWLAAG